MKKKEEVEWLLRLLPLILLLIVAVVYREFLEPLFWAALLSIPLVKLKDVRLSWNRGDKPSYTFLLFIAACFYGLAGVHGLLLLFPFYLLKNMVHWDIRPFRRLPVWLYLVILFVIASTVSILLFVGSIYEIHKLSQSLVWRLFNLDRALVLERLEFNMTRMLKNYNVDLRPILLNAQRIVLPNEMTNDANTYEILITLVEGIPPFLKTVSFSRVLEMARKFVSVEQVTGLIEVLLTILGRLVSVVAASTSALLRSFTFFSFLYHLLGRTESLFSSLQQIMKLEGREAEILNRVEEEINAIFCSTIALWWHQLALTFSVLKLCGSPIAMLASLLCSISAVLPIFSPNAIVFLTAILQYLNKAAPSALLIITSYLIIKRTIKPPTRLDGHEYWANLTVIIGFWSLGLKGLIIGPLLTVLPIILYS